MGCDHCPDSRFCDHVWCGDLQNHTVTTLAGLKGTIPSDFSGGQTNLLYGLANLLVMLPPKEAEALLEPNWDHLKYSPRMIHAAFRIGTPKAVVLAEQGMAICPADVDVFKLASSLWNCGHSSNPITVRHLENLALYLDRMSEDEIRSFGWEAERAKDPDGSIGEWIRQYLVPQLSPEERTRIRVADEHLLSRLDDSF